MENPEISYSSGDVPGPGKPWSPSSDDNSPFIEVKIPPGSTFVGVITEGNPDQPQWVSKYEISYTTDGVHWVVIDKVFEGNHDSITEQTNYVVPSIPNVVAIRIIPVEWIDNGVKHTDESYEKISIIVTVLLDCKASSTTTETPTTPTPTPTVTTTSIQTTTPCSIPMENPEISYSSGDVPGPGKPWSPSSDDNSPFIEVKIPPGSTFVGVITEGNPDQPQWVSKYEISYTTDGVHWVVIDKVFEGNHDSITEQTNYVVPSIPNVVAIRIIPVEWIDNGVKHTDESYEKISIIVTVLLDCKASSTTTETTTPTTTSIQTTTPCYYIMPIPKIKYSSSSDEQTSANSASSEVDSHESWTPNKHDRCA
ncbi:EGF-like repeat and discoidin I-like domain-containing protein 3 [Lampetra planeri]